MELQPGGDVSRSPTVADSMLAVVISGSIAMAVDATLGAGRSTVGDVTAGAWMQQVGLTAGVVFGGQQWWAKVLWARYPRHKTAGAVATTRSIITAAIPNLALLAITVTLRYCIYDAQSCDLCHGTAIWSR
jgi:hypothetical protein